MLRLSGCGSQHALLNVGPIRGAWGAGPVCEKTRSGAGAWLPRPGKPRHIAGSKVLDRLLDVASATVIRAELSRDHWVGRGGGAKRPVPVAGLLVTVIKRVRAIGDILIRKCETAANPRKIIPPVGPGDDDDIVRRERTDLRD